MITLKQIETLRWIIELGTFERAAAKLNATQSTISKRIQELELSAGIHIFDRSQRGARLTDEGEQLLAIGRDMLTLQTRMLGLKKGGLAPARRLRLGVTELSGITWLPRLVAALRQTWPALVIEPEVDMSRSLFERLLEGKIDLIVIPESFGDADVEIVRLAEVSNAWMAQPGLVKLRRRRTLHDLADYPILQQGSRSGSGLFYNKWLKAQGVVFQKTLSTDSMMALVGMTVAGLGVSYLPAKCFSPLVAEGKLAIIAAAPALPPVPYAAMYRKDRPSAFTSTVAEMARSICDFSRQLQS